VGEKLSATAFSPTDHFRRYRVHRQIDRFARRQATIIASAVALYLGAVARL
jgi:hypothetical protein